MFRFVLLAHLAVYSAYGYGVDNVNNNLAVTFVSSSYTWVIDSSTSMEQNPQLTLTSNARGVSSNQRVMIVDPGSGNGASFPAVATVGTLTRNACNASRTLGDLDSIVLTPIPQADSGAGTGTTTTVQATPITLSFFNTGALNNNCMVSRMGRAGRQIYNDIIVGNDGGTAAQPICITWVKKGGNNDARELQKCTTVMKTTCLNLLY